MAMPSKASHTADLGLRLDIVAAASVGKCKAEHRRTIIDANAETDFWNCLEKYSQDILAKWGSRESKGYTYYYQRGRGASQWERPAVLQKDIADGLAVARAGTDYSPDRPWETCELLSTAHYMCLQRRQGSCQDTQGVFMQCRKSRGTPTFNMAGGA
ncbi:hypothetical protein DIPPA_02493 [Diplonema papillatum]|nr:hypothetical protein DIPPA_02493 [Diplonema papillatum]